MNLLGQMILNRFILSEIILYKFFLEQFYYNLINSDLKLVFKYIENASMVDVNDKLRLLKELSEKDSLDNVQATTALEKMRDVYLIFITYREDIKEILTISID